MLGDASQAQVDQLHWQGAFDSIKAVEFRMGK
jgi:hypothetical protein